VVPNQTIPSGSTSGPRTLTYTLYTDNCYSLAGDLVRVTQPMANVNGENCAAAAPSFTTQNIYGANHRLTSTLDARGDAPTTYMYYPNGTTQTMTDPQGKVTAYQYDGMNRVIEENDPFSTTHPLVKTEKQYDKVGNLSHLFTPRAVDTAGAGTATYYVTSYHYDGDNRLIQTDLPFSNATAEQDHSFQRYDPNGYLTLTTLPDPATCVATDSGCAAPVPNTKQTNMTYLDPGWLHQSFTAGRATKHDGTTSSTSPTITLAAPEFKATDVGEPITGEGIPAGATIGQVTNGNSAVLWSAQNTPINGTGDFSNVSFVIGPILASQFSYRAEGWQTSRIPLINGLRQANTNQTWVYWPDGKIRSRGEDLSGSSGSWTYAYDADNNLIGSKQTVGPAIDIVASYDGLDRLARTDSSRNDGNYDYTSYAYDLNGNTTDTEQNGVETSPPTANPSSKVVTAGNKFGYEYDPGNWLTDQCTNPVPTAPRCATPTTSSDQRILNSFTPNGWEQARAIQNAVANGSSWKWAPLETINWSYFDNGKLQTLATCNSAGTSADPVTGLMTVCNSNAALEQHTVSYTDSNNIYNDGFRTQDSFSINGPSSGGACSVNCTAVYTYDASDRVSSENDGHGDVTNYTLDSAGNITKQQVTVNGGPSSTTNYMYANTQLQTKQDVNGKVLERYFYDGLGRLTCVTDGVGYSACPAPAQGSTSTASSDLLRTYDYDFLDHLTAYQSFNGGNAGASAQYHYDALQRVDSEIDKHPGSTSTVPCRSTAFTYLGLTSSVSQEVQTVSNQGTCASPTPIDTKTYSYDVYGHRTSMSDTQTSKTYEYGYNVHDSTSLLIDATTGNPVQTYGYGAYGQTDTTLTTADIDPLKPLNEYRYAGMRLDVGSGTIDMGARRFGPDISHFLQQDYFKDAFGDLGLSEDPLTQNRYDLAGGNPLSFIEAGGHVFTNDGGGTGSNSPNPNTADTGCNGPHANALGCYSTPHSSPSLNANQPPSVAFLAPGAATGAFSVAEAAGATCAVTAPVPGADVATCTSAAAVATVSAAVAGAITFIAWLASNHRAYPTGPCSTSANAALACPEPEPAPAPTASKPGTGKAPTLPMGGRLPNPVNPSDFVPGADGGGIPTLPPGGGAGGSDRPIPRWWFALLATLGGATYEVLTHLPDLNPTENSEPPTPFPNLGTPASSPTYGPPIPTGAGP